MNWREVRLVYAREMRSAFREPSIVVNSVLLPIFLYPGLLWLAFSALAFAEGVSEGYTPRIGLAALPSEHRGVLDGLRRADDLEVRHPMDLHAALALLGEGRLDAVVEVLPASDEAGRVPGNFRTRIHYDRSIQRSSAARGEVMEIVEDYRRDWLTDRGRVLGIDPETGQQFGITLSNVASERQMGAVILGRLVPLFLVIMVALGCFMPAIDSTAGERERSTWETLMSAAASRMSIIVGKYLYVSTVGILAGLLNVVAIFASIGAVMRPILAARGASVSFEVPLMALPVMMAGAVGLALFFGAAMMILASFARTFRDGQAMVAPIYWMALLPVLLGQQTDQTLTPVLAAIPVANVAMMTRDALSGVFLWPLIGATLVVQLLLVVGCLLLARAILRFEDFLIGSHDGSFFRFARERLILFRPSSAAPRVVPGGRGAAGGDGKAEL